MDHQDATNSNDSSLRRSSRLRATGVATRPPPRTHESSSSSSTAISRTRRKKKIAVRPKLRPRSNLYTAANTTTMSRKRSSSCESEESILESPVKKSRKLSHTSKDTTDEAVSTLDARKTVTPVSRQSRKQSPFREEIGDVVALLPLRKTSDAGSVSSLPDGVSDLYPTTAMRPCACDDDHCSGQSLSHCFLKHYGKEFFQSLKDWETLYFPTGNGNNHSDNDSSDDTRSFASSSSSGSSRGTPLDRVNYVIGSVAEEETMADTSTVSSSTTLLENQPHLTEKMRGVLVDWLIELSEEYNLSARTLHLTVVLLNRSLEGSDNEENQLGGNVMDDDSSSSSSTNTKGRRLVIDRDMFQCLGCACMWMASKMEEISSPTVDDFVYISADSYTKREITEMEMAVCGALQFRLWHVTPHDFCEEFLRASSTTKLPRFGCPVVESSLERSMVQYILALSLLPYDFVSLPPRKIAAAAMYLTRIVLGITPAWSPTLQHYSNYNMWDLEDAVLTLHRYQASAEESKLSNAFHKFSKEKYHCVALKTVPLEQDLGF